MDNQTGAAEAELSMKEKIVYFWALLDQIIFGASASVNFIILENLIPLDTYALLATYYSYIVLYQMVASTMLMDAFAVKLPVLGMQRAQIYFLYVIKLFLQISVVMCVIVCSAYLAVRGTSMHNLADILTFVSSAISFSMMMFVRRFCYSIKMVVYSLVASTTYIALYSVALAIGYAMDLLDLRFIFCSILLSSFTAFLVVSLRIGVLRAISSPGSKSVCTSALRKFHREYAGAGFVLGSLKWIPDNLLFSLLAFWGSLEQVAIYRMASNLVMPFRHLVVALVNVMLPKYSQLAARGRSSEGWRHVALFTAGFMGIGVMIFFAFLFFGESLLTTIYKSDTGPVLQVILVLSLVPAFSAAHAFAGAYLKSIGLIKYVVIQSFFGAMVTVTIGSWLVRSVGAMGAAYTLVTSMVLMFLLGFFFAVRSQRCNPAISHGIEN